MLRHTLQYLVHASGNNEQKHTERGPGRMTKEWLKVVAAACFEVMWVIGLKHADDVLSWIATIIAIILSFYGLIAAGKHLPGGTVYAVFVGLGTAGTVIAEIVLFDEPAHPGKLLLIGLLLIGVIGLKLVTPDQDQPKPEGHTPGERTDAVRQNG